LAVDELYDGPFCVLSAVDSKRQRRLVCQVLEDNPTQEHIRDFFLGLQAKLAAMGLKVLGVTTDGSQLYPEPLRQVWPEARHQVCRFHVLRDITRAILRAVAKVRKQLAKQIPKLPPGRPSTAEHKRLARRAERLRRQIAELFDGRHLFVQKVLTPSERRRLERLCRRHPDLKPLRQLMEEVYRLFDRRCRIETAKGRLEKLRARLSRFKSLGKVLAKLESPNLDKALTFLDDRLLEGTSNSVERANRRHRKMQKSVYRVRAKVILEGRIALDLFRDMGGETRLASLALLHHNRSSPDGGLHAFTRSPC
jgi:hypothetical protein